MISPLTDQLKGALAVARATLIPERPDRLPRAALAVLPWGPTLAGALAAATARYPFAVAVRDDWGDLSYASLWLSSDALARGLRARGVVAGSVVGILARNHRGFVRSLVAASKLGADIVFLNTGFAGPQLADVVSSEGIEFLLHDDEFAPVVTTSRLSGAICERQMTEMAANWSVVPIIPERRRSTMVILTSGTTGRPKGARRAGLGRPAMAGSVFATIPARARDTVVVTAPLFHAWGLSNLGIALGLSSTIVLARTFDPEAVVASVAEHRANGLVVVPILLKRILMVAPSVLDGYDTSSLRYIASSGSALGGPLATAASARFGPILHNIYGSTEVSLAAVAHPEDLLAAPSTAGRAPLGTILQVLGDDYLPVATGTTGRIFVASPARFDGYTGGDNKESVDGLMAIGDVGHLDEEGRLFVEGRDDDMIISGGENVYPAEIEELLLGHPSIRDAAVIGVEDLDYGQRLKAYVVADPDANVRSAEVSGYVRDHLARYKVPRDIVFVDTLPRTTTGKLLRRQLP